MERPHGGSCNKDGSTEDKHDKETTANKSELPSCGSSVRGPKSVVSNSRKSGIENKMETDSPLLMSSLTSLPAASSITITKASARSSQSSPSSSPPPATTLSSLASSSSTSTGSAIKSSLSSASSVSTVSSSSSDVITNISNGVLGPDMMPTIPLVPVQVPTGRGGVITIPKAPRGRPKAMPLHTSRGGFSIRKGVKIKRIGLRGRGGRRLVHSTSLDERGSIGGDDSPLPLDDDNTYSQDDMVITPSYQEKWPRRTCALCNLNEQSQLGQGELMKHDPTPGYSLPEKFESADDSSSEDGPNKKFKPGHPNFLKDKGKSPRKQIGELILPEPVDEISLVGHQDQPSVTDLFESSGHCLVHYMCALWSSNVELSSEDTISKIDMAVVAGASQRCAHCKKFGATIPCKVSGCTKLYHFPCAMYDGAPMDLKSVAMVCPSHAHKSRDLLVDMACMICEHSSPESSLLFCSSCGNHYHGLCLKPPLTATPAVRAGWQCPDCKLCQMCRQPSDDLVCGVCDKAYHMVCARPFGLSLLKTGWKCKTCRACGDCGSRTPGNGMSSRWHNNFTVCDSCYQLRNKGLACPICRKAYRAIAQKSMAQCSKCKKHIHSTCDPDADISLIQSKHNADKSYEYVCLNCNQIAPSPNQSPHISQEDSCDGPPGSSLHSEDSNDTDIISEGKYEELPPTPKAQSIITSPLSSSSSFNRGKPLSLSKRGGGYTPRMRGGGTGGKCSPGKKNILPSSRKRGKNLPIRRGRGSGRGYRGYFNYQNVSLQVMESNHGTGKEEGEENKVILVAAKDEFCLEQDVCAMCGAFGQDHEGRLISCAQCGQCYHPYCANVKVTKVVLQKGWRCLDCTVCEGCGERNDEARLVLCEDCDISYHIYCMSPPLDIVPSGVWRCKWCAICQYCGATDPGPNSTWQQNYSMCGPCMSMLQCPVCDEAYSDGELIIQCTNCERWLHASDDMIHTEEQAERCALKGYLCLMCRPQDALPPHLMPLTPPPRRPPPPPPPPPVPVAPPSPVKPASPNSEMMNMVSSKSFYWVDGICLSESGMCHIKTQTLEPLKKSRNPPKSIRSSRGLSLDSSGSRDMDDDEDEEEEKIDDEPRHWVYGMKEGTILKAKEDGTPPDLPEGFYTLPGPEPGIFTLRKRRYRNIKTLGIGGFQVRARGKKEEERLKEEATLDPQVLELRRKRSNWRTKKKIKLLEKFPSYIQEAFFGRNLMDTSNLEEEMKIISSGLEDKVLDEDSLETVKSKSAITLSKDELQLVQAAQNKQHGRLENLEQQSKLSPSHKDDGVPHEKKEGEKKEKDEEMAEEDENNEAFDAIFAPGCKAILSDILMDDIMSDAIKDEDEQSEEALSPDTIGQGAGTNGTKLTDILGPGFNLDDMADIMKNLPEDSTEDSQDSAMSSIPPATGVRSDDRSLNREKIERPSPGNSPNRTIIHPVNPVTAASGNITAASTLPSASTLRPNQPPVAPLNSVPVLPVISHGPTVTSLPLSSTLQVVSSGTLIKNPVGLPSSITHLSNSPAKPLPSVVTQQTHVNSVQPGTVTTLISSGISHHSSVPPHHTSSLPPHHGSGHPLAQHHQAPAVPPHHTSTLPPHQSVLPPHPINISSHQTVVQHHPSNLPPHPNTLPPHQSPHTPHHSPLPPHQSPLPPHQSPLPPHQSPLPPHQSPLPPHHSPLPPHASPLSSHTSPLPSPITGGAPSSIPVSHPSPLSRSDSQSSPLGYPPSTPTTSKPSTPTVPEPQKVWSNDSNSQSLSLEEDESLGEKATKAAVLYVNVHKPTLKTDYPSVADRERQIRRIWKNLKDTEQKKLLIQTARENKKEYYKNKQEQQRALRNSTDSMDSNTATLSSLTSSGNVSDTTTSSNPSPGNVSQVVHRPATLPSLVSSRPLLISQQRPHLTTASPSIRHSHVHTLVRGPASNIQGASESYSHSTSLPSRPSPLSSSNDSFSQPSTPRPPISDGYATPSSTTRLVVSGEPYVMPPPTPRPSQESSYHPQSPGSNNRPSSLSDSFNSSPSDSFNQSSSYAQVPGTPRPHDDGYSQPPTPGPPPSSGTIQGDPVRQQQLRELLQRQQSRTWTEASSSTNSVVQSAASPTGPAVQFRHPLPPQVQGAIRMRPSLVSGQPTSGPPQGGQIDPRVRMVLHRHVPPQQQGVIGRSPVDPYKHVVQQQYIHLSGPGNVRPGGPPPTIVRGPPPGSVVVSQGASSPHMPSQDTSVPVPIASPNHPSSPHSLGSSHPQPSHPSVSRPSQLHQPRPPTAPLSHIQSRTAHIPPAPSQPQTPQQQILGESELPEAVTRELEQLEEEQQQHQQQPSTNTSSQPSSASGGTQPPTNNSSAGSNQGDDLDDIGPSDLPTMEEDLLAIGGDFNALLEFADGADEEECEEKLPTNLFDLDAVEEERRKREKLSEMGIPRGRLVLGGNIPVGSQIARGSPLQASEGQPHLPPSSFALIRSNSNTSSPVLSTSGQITEASGNEGQNLHLHQRLSDNSSIDSASVPPGGDGSVPPSTVISVGPPSRSPVGPPPGPIMGTVRMGMSSPQQHPTQPQMAPHINQATPRLGSVVTRLAGPRGMMIRQPAPPPPPYPGHPPPPPYPRSQEQPLLIEDLLEQEKLEQMKQQKSSQHPNEAIGPDGLNLSEVEFEKLKADVLNVNNPPGTPGMSSGSVIRTPFQRIVGQPSPIPGQTVYQSSGPAQPLTRPVRPQGDPGLHPALLQAATPRATITTNTPTSVTIKTIPPPPQPPDNPLTEAERQQTVQYEQWLAQQHQCISSQLRYYEQEITKLRKQRKSLNSRQRTLKKNGQELSENDAAELSRVQREASAIQRHLEQCRKSSRQHAMIIQEYNNKKRQRQVINNQASQGNIISGTSPMGHAGSSPMHSTPQSPLMSPSPSSQPSMGMSPMVHSPHTPVASPNAVIVPQHSPHGIVVPGPHHSPGESVPFSPQARSMPSPGGGYPEQGGSRSYPGTPQGVITPHHHMMNNPQMRVRMPVHSPGTQTVVQPGQISPHMIRPGYPQPGMISQNPNPSMIMRHQYPQGVMPLRRSSSSGPVPSPGSNGPIPSPGSSVQSPIGGNLTMRQSPVHVHSGLKSPVPLASPSPGGPVSSPLSGNTSMKPSPVHSGLRSPVPLASPQMRPHSVENPGTPLTPRSGIDMGGAPQTPHSDAGGGASSNGSQVNSPHPSASTPTSDAVPSPSPSSSTTPTPGGGVNIGSIGSGTGNSNGSGGGNGSNSNPAPFPPHMPRFGYFKLGLPGGSMVRSRWGHYKFGLKGGGILGEVEDNSLQPVPCNTVTSVFSSVSSTVANTTSAPSNPTSSSISQTGLKKEDTSLVDEGQEGLAHVLSESIKGPVVRMPMMGGAGGPSRVSQSSYASTTSTSVIPQLSSNSTTSRVIVPEPSKSEIPPSSRHQAVIGIPGGGVISQASVMYANSNVTVASSMRLPSTISSGNYLPSSNVSSASSYTSTASLPVSSSGLSLNYTPVSSSLLSDTLSTGNHIPSSIFSSSITLPSTIYDSDASRTNDISTLSSMVSNNDQVSGLTNANTTLPISMVSSATTHTTSALGRPLLSIPLHQIGSQSRSTANPIVSSQPVRTLPSISHLQAGARHFRTQLLRASVSQQPGSQESIHHVVAPQQIIQQSVGQHVSLASTENTQALSHQNLVYTSSGSLPSESVIHGTQHAIVHGGVTQSGTLVQGRISQSLHENVPHTVVQGGIPHSVVQTGIPQTVVQGNVAQTLVPASVAQTLVQGSVAQTIIQGSVPQTVVQGGVPQTVRMVAQPVVMQPALVRGGSVMVRPSLGSQVAVQGGVRMMMIHGGPVRTPSPPVNRPAMMPPPAAKSPAGHSASPIQRVSPAQSPLSNHPSPHSPQLGKGQSPIMGSPNPSPHNSTPPNLIKRDPDDERPRSCGTPLQGGGGTLHLQAQSQPTHLASAIVSSSIKSEHAADGGNKESSNALLKQLLENTGCASPLQQPPQGQQVVLFRSTQGPLPIPSSQLSQVASQLPNPTPIVVPRSVVSSSIPGSHSSSGNTSSVTTVLHRPVSNENQHISHPVGHGPQVVHRSVVVSSGPHPQSIPAGHTVVLSQQPSQVISHAGGQVNIAHAVTRPANIIHSQHDLANTSNTVTTTGLPPHHQSSQLIGVRQVTHHPNQTVTTSPGHHSTPGQVVGPAGTGSHPTHHVVHHSSPHVVVHPGLRPSHPGKPHSQLISAHPPGTQIIQQGTRSLPQQTIVNSIPTPASLADRLNSNPGLKTEMRVMIPETVTGTGGSTGEHTPEMMTPNDSSDALDPEELKRAKKRAQQARRKSQSKDAKVQPAKRARQGSRVEEDYDTYIESLMQQLRAMPPLTIMEPEVPRNFNLCPMFGSGDLSKLGRRDYNYRQGVLEGNEGSASVKNVTDHYNTQPFGDKLPIVTPAKTGPTQRGFYIHEFTPPKIGLPLDEYQEPDGIITVNPPVNRPTSASSVPRTDADSPDTILSSSSPECMLPESPIPFKGLRLVDMDEDQDDLRDRSTSPTIPLLVPIPLRPGQLPFLSLDRKDVKDNPELDKENIGSLSSITMKSRLGQSPAMPLKDKGNVTVTLTLSSQAGDDVSGVLRSLANLLNIPPPKSYQMTDRFEVPNLPRLYHHKHQKDGKEQIVDIQSILNGKARFCRHCDIIIEENILSKRVCDLPFLNKEEFGGIEELTFCSQPCYVQFAVAHRTVIEEKKPLDAVKIKTEESKDPLKKKISENKLPDWKKDGMEEVLKVPQFEDSIHSRPNKHKLEEEPPELYPKQADGKRFRGHKYKYWTPNALTLPEIYEKPTLKEMTDLLFRMGITYRKMRLRDDSRQCNLCKLYGDYVADGPSRLLNYDVDKWVHLNCALWLEEVYETMNGALMNVDQSMKKIMNHLCEHCEQYGASVKCFKVRCCKMYHLNCAVKEGCTFYKNKTVFCHEHINKGEKDNELSTLSVFRRVFIDREDNRQVASVMHNADFSYLLRIGSLILISIGQLLPSQLQAFHTPYCIYPVGYQVIRYYWSMRRIHKRCAYECSIHEKEGQPEFQIIVKEEGFEDCAYKSCSPKGVWNKILEPIAEMRQKADVVRLFPQYISGEDLFGLNEPAIVRILESLPGVDSLSDYNFKFGRNPLFELPLAVNPTGCARSEPFNKLHLKRYHGLRTSVGSVRTASNCRTAAAIASLTMTYDPFISYSKMHVHSRSSQYKKMNNEWRSTVYLARSKIAGLGLYAARDIEKNTMIIEYIGEIIRSELAEVREKRYEAMNRGIYMFRLDDQRVVDATVTGGLARYINHSCGPNCYTETIEVEKDLKILIISNRKIFRGEELAYDYKFDEEEDHKIPCLCGADNCRKWMN